MIRKVGRQIGLLAVDDIACKTELRNIAQNHILVQQMKKILWKKICRLLMKNM